MLPENAHFAAHFGLLTNIFLLAKRKLGNHGKPMHLISKAFLIFPFFTPSLRIRSNQHADMITLTSSSLLQRREEAWGTIYIRCGGGCLGNTNEGEFSNSERLEFIIARFSFSPLSLFSFVQSSLSLLFVRQIKQRKEKRCLLVEIGTNFAEKTALSSVCHIIFLASTQKRLLFSLPNFPIFHCPLREKKGRGEAS